MPAALRLLSICLLCHHLYHPLGCHLPRSFLYLLILARVFLNLCKSTTFSKGRFAYLGTRLTRQCTLSRFHHSSGNYFGHNTPLRHSADIWPEINMRSTPNAFLPTPFVVGLCPIFTGLSSSRKPTRSQIGLSSELLSAQVFKTAKQELDSTCCKTWKIK
jgi:hypothetical protein